MLWYEYKIGFSRNSPLHNIPATTQLHCSFPQCPSINDEAKTFILPLNSVFPAFHKSLSQAQSGTSLTQKQTTGFALTKFLSVLIYTENDSRYTYLSWNYDRHQNVTDSTVSCDTDNCDDSNRYIYRSGFEE